MIPEIPPKYSKVFIVESSSGCPELSAPIEIRLSAKGVSIRWIGEVMWNEIDWYEIAICAEAPGHYRQIIDAWKVQAFEEGLSDGVKAAATETATLDYAEELKEVRERERQRQQLEQNCGVFDRDGGGAA